MSGTYQIDGELFITNPLSKRWQRQSLGHAGSAPPIYTPYWTFEVSFGTLAYGSGSAQSFLMDKWLEDGLHGAVLPHPKTGYLSIFSGVSIESVTFDIPEFDRDRWTTGGRMILGHISLESSWDIPGQPYWWFDERVDVVMDMYASGTFSPA